MIGLVTDSSAQLPDPMAVALGAEIVPVIIVVDGAEHREGVDIDAERFWTLIAAGPSEVTTAQPSPGDFAAAYDRLVERGANAIVSVHVGEAYSGTVNSARLGASMTTVPVQVIDSGTASFGVGCCVWEAADAIAAGADVREVVDRVEAVAPVIETAFILQAADFARSGGRFAFELVGDVDAVAVFAGRGADIEMVGAGRTVEELCDLMVDRLLAPTGRLRAGVSLADPATLPFTEGIEARLRASDRSIEMVRYRVGPSVAAHTGPGTAGGFSYPR